MGRLAVVRPCAWQPTILTRETARVTSCWMRLPPRKPTSSACRRPHFNPNVFSVHVFPILIRISARQGMKGDTSPSDSRFLSKQPLAKLQYEPPTVGLFGFYSASISWHGTEARLVNVHLTPFVIPRDSGLLGVMNAILSTERKHALEIAAIAKTIDPSTPTIILGDFNSLSAFSAPRHLAELGFVDSYGSIYEDAEEHPTWRWPTRPVPLSLRIDFIFHTGHFKTVESTIIQRAGSDHSLVVSVLKLLEQTRRALREKLVAAFGTEEGDEILWRVGVGH